MENINQEILSQEKIDYRLIITPFILLLLFFFFSNITYNFESYVKVFWVKHNLIYSYLELIQDRFTQIITITIIFLTGYNPLKWSKDQIILLRNTDQRLLKRKFIYFVLLLVLILIIRSIIGFIFFPDFYNLSVKEILKFRRLLFFFIGAFYEELLCKGLLYRSLIQIKNPKYMKYIWMIITSAIFSFCHIFVYTSIYSHIFAFTYSLITLFAFNLYPSIWLCTFHHSIVNILSYKFL